MEAAKGRDGCGKEVLRIDLRGWQRDTTEAGNDAYERVVLADGRRLVHTLKKPAAFGARPMTEDVIDLV